MLRRHYDACIYAVENGGMLQAKININIMQVSLEAPDFVLKEGERIW